MNSTTPSSAAAYPGLGADLNVVVVRGTLSSDPVRRELPSGDVVHNYEVTVRHPSSAADSVPVARFTNGRVPKLEQGDVVVVTGRVRRRFFRAGGSTASRTEIVADSIVGAGSTKAVRAVDTLLEPLFDQPE